MKVIKILFLTALYTCGAWLLLSWIEVAAHNITPGYAYNDLNLFYLLIKGA